MKETQNNLETVTVFLKPPRLGVPCDGVLLFFRGGVYNTSVNKVQKPSHSHTQIVRLVRRIQCVEKTKQPSWPILKSHSC